MQNGAVLAARPTSYAHGAMQLDKIEEAVRCDLYIYMFEVNRYALLAPKASFTYPTSWTKTRNSVTSKADHTKSHTTMYILNTLLANRKDSVVASEIKIETLTISKQLHSSNYKR